MLPNFLGIGAQRSGTTSLFAILRQHPNIYLPEVKETGFFCDDNQFKKGIEYYERIFFSKWRGEKAVGEISPDYLLVEYVPERIYHTLGKETKLIVMLRNPAERAWSNYLMNLARGIEDKPFEEAIRLEEKRIKRGPSSLLNFSYLKRGLYAEQIRRYLRFFPRENFFFIIFETDFLQNRQRTIEQLLGFLDVEKKVKLNLAVHENPAWKPRSVVLTSVIYRKPKILKKIAKLLIPWRLPRLKILLWLDRLNRRPLRYTSLDSKLKRFLLERYFAEDIRELEKLTGRDLSVWF
ncbi:sulfotransferase domain-containing protein [bacterium]|nr:sulfotransferase domain-containing protein [bacterium]